MSTLIVDTGIANIASVRAAFGRLSVSAETTVDRADIEAAEFLVLPGVGSFGAGMRALEKLGIADALRERIRLRRPTLCVCLGLQLLAKSSEESPGVEGLGCLDATVSRLPDTARSPQMGWNTVGAGAGSGAAYFANTFALDRDPSGWQCESTLHGRAFPALIRSGGVLGCQFHPELSGAWGEALIADWLGLPPNPTLCPLPRTGTRLIPCLDVRDGRVVKGVQFNGLRDAGDPVDCARRYERAGADEIVVLDIAATAEGRAARTSLIGELRSILRIPLCVGGGVRTIEDAAELLRAGADKVAVNTAAVLNPKLIGDLSERFGRQCIVVSIDAVGRPLGGWDVVIRAGSERTELDVVEFARTAEQRGAGELLLTSFDRDGTRDGYDLELLTAVRAAVQVPVIASGGAGSVGHLVDAARAGADAVLAASIFHDEDEEVASVKTALAAAGSTQC